MKYLFIVLLISIFIINCAPDYKAQIKSDTSWSGSFDNRTVDGDGNDIINLSNEHPVCCVAQKQTEDGYLHIRVINDNKNIIGPGNSSWAKTTAAYGVVSACSED